MRNRIFATAAALAMVVGIAIPVAALEEQDPALAVLGASTTETASLPQTVPFRSVAGYIVVDVSLDGAAETVPLIVDSGAPTNLSSEVVDELGLAPLASLVMTAIDGSEFQQDVVTVPAVSIGGAMFTDVGAVKGFLEPGDPLTCISDAGIIGASLMKDAVWQFDYQAQELTIARSTVGLDHVDDVIELDFTVDFAESPSPVVNVVANDRTLIFVVDTGSDGPLAVSTEDLETVEIDIPDGAPAFDVLASGATGTFASRLEFTHVDLILPGIVIEDFPLGAERTLTPGSGNMGSAFLDDFVVTIDWPSRRLYLDPVNDPIGPTEPGSASLGWDGEHFVIAAIVDGTEPDDEGFELGAVVTAVDGQDVSAATLDDYCRFFTDDKVGRHEVTLADGQTITLAPVEGFYGTGGS